MERIKRKPRHDPEQEDSLDNNAEVDEDSDIPVHERYVKDKKIRRY